MPYLVSHTRESIVLFSNMEWHKLKLGSGQTYLFNFKKAFEGYSLTLTDFKAKLYLEELRSNEDVRVIHVES